MRAIRREERLESALLEVDRLLAPIAMNVMRMKLARSADPESTVPESFRPAISCAIETLIDRWEEGLSVAGVGAHVGFGIDKLLIVDMPSVPWRKDDPDVWTSADETQEAAGEMHARIREILGTARPMPEPELG